ncbi:UNVERIFIED_CONTAM: hypothetical protein GTU68_000168 [Idotea baltica]|nr:hypothetical protein [Idotea baltica]
MSNKCQISGVARQSGNRVSHAKNRTKHVFKANIQKKKFFVPSEGKHVSLKVTARMMRTIDKLGVTGALKKNGINIKDLM